jgi:cellulase/cellobiase CelA1
VGSRPHHRAGRPRPAGASPPLTLSIRIQSQWQDGFVADVTIRNAGASAINGWTLAWTFPGNQRITNMWNATTTVPSTGPAISATDAGWNRTIAGQTATTTRPTTTVGQTTTTSGQTTSTIGGGGQHLANPYAGARGYVNPDWAAQVTQDATATGGTLRPGSTPTSG